MTVTIKNENVQSLVDELNFAQKVDRSLGLIREAYEKFGDGLVVANSLGKDSCAVWHLAKRVSPDIRGFIVTTRFQHKETIEFMSEVVKQYPELKVYKNDVEIPNDLYRTDPEQCCGLLKVEPTRRAIKEMGATCWVTGLRCTEGRTRTEYKEVEERDPGLIKLNPIIIWKEREIWQYLAVHSVKVNPIYIKGYRSLDCYTCTQITTDDNERAGRWMGTSKWGGECGIHTRPLKISTIK